MIKLMAIDLDGTLLNGQKRISARNIETLKQAKEHGVKIVICTGRPLASVMPYLETLDLLDEGDYAVTFNGGMVQKNHSGERILNHHFSVADIEKMAKEMAQHDLPLDVISGQKVFHVQPTPKERTSIYHTMNPNMDFHHLIVSDFDEKAEYNKMVVAVEDQEFLDQKIESLSEEIKSQYNFVKSRPNLLEILHKEVSKANALEKLGEYLDIQLDEMMALGDEENDLSMIQAVGLGVAMGNAVPEVKVLAQHITDTNEADGVAKAVEQFVLEPIIIEKGIE